MKLLVTGGAGFIGSNFIRYWLTAHPNDSVVNLDALTYAGSTASLDDVVRRFANRYTFVHGSIGDYPLVVSLLREHRPDIIVNFAAESHNSRAVLNPSIFVETNVKGTQQLLEAARTVGVDRFHHISTCEVYGDLPLESTEKFTEESPYRPRTPYNASKAAADLLVRAYHQTFNLPVTISNAVNNYGTHQFPEKVIPHFTIRGLRREPLPLYRNSSFRREWIHVLDHCAAIEAVLFRGRVGETYNVGTGVEADIETIARHVLEELGLDESFKTYVEDRPGHDRRYVLDSSKIETQLNWKPRVPFDRGIREAIRWYRDSESWWRPLLERHKVKEESWK